MASFVIDRPIFGWVIAIVIMLAGAGAIHQLALERYPDIAPTRVSINTSYPGASAKAIEDSVTQIVEQAPVWIRDFIDSEFFRSLDDQFGVRDRVTEELDKFVNDPAGWVESSAVLSALVPPWPTDFSAP